MREIAAEAHLSPGNLYHYFKGKHEILFYCQNRWLDTMLAEVESARRTRAAAPERLRRILEAHVRRLLDEMEGSAAHLEVEALPPALRKKIIAKRDRYERGIRQLVSSGVRKGEFVTCDPRVVTRGILGALNWTARWFRPDGPDPVSEVATSLAEYLVRGLAARPGRSLGPTDRVQAGGNR
jgi:AcrR family transcriptional regulator